MVYTKNGRTFHCPVEAALDVIGGKWKPLIVWHLCDATKRFSELQRELPGVNAKMLTKQLRSWRRTGSCGGRSTPSAAPVEYAVTDFGRTLLPVMEALCAWGTQYLGIDDKAPSGCPAKTGREEA
jgi:DNA-binding HxlR family transcriptional regulator